MFSLRVFGGLARQRRACLASTEFMPPAVHADTARLVAALGDAEAIVVRGSVWSALFRSVRHLVLQSALLNLLGASALLASVLCTERILSHDGASGSLLGLCLGFFAFQSLNLGVGYFADLLRVQIRTGAGVRVLSILNAKLLSLDRTRAQAFSTGTLKTLVSSDIKHLTEFIDACILNAVPFAVACVVHVPGIAFTMGWPGLVGVAVALAQVPVSVVTARAIERIHLSVQAQRDDVSTLLGEWLRNVRLIRSLSWQDAFRDDIAARLRKLVIAAAREHVLTCLIFGSSFAWWMLPIGAVVATALMARQDLALGPLFASVWLLNQLSSALQHVPAAITKYGAASACVTRVERLLRAPAVSDGLKSESLGDPWPEGVAITAIHLEDVSASYGDRTVLEHVTARFGWNEKVAITGPVASGKTTLLRILVGDMAPSAGRLLVEFANGARLDVWRRGVHERVRAQLAYAPQEPFLSNATLAQNITLEDAPEERGVLDAAADAELEADIAQFAQGLDEPVGEVGLNLSGGQKQRVSLARALFSRRPFLLLDDPLSAVDPITERRLMDTLLARPGGFILVSHRHGELHRADRILTLNQGTLAEEGPR